uniref:Uncharacterized protein n=1 Tax=Siphoviridae sp. ctsxw88 TaxID=2825701 RepID=A0A8S5PH80_9CAUD|nr:MAG TPA: hypothetical protein [Siphoviridae sp. ctsxw88]
MNSLILPLHHALNYIPSLSSCYRDYKTAAYLLLPNTPSSLTPSAASSPKISVNAISRPLLSSLISVTLIISY